MDLAQENLAVVCVTERALIRGRVHTPDDVDGPTVEQERPPSTVEFVHLANVTIFDHERRIVKRVPRLAINKAFIIYFYEDDVGPQLDRVKAMIAAEDYDNAQAELERLLSGATYDGELLYLAGVVYHHGGNEDRAKECFARALKVTLDEKLRTVIARHLEP